MISIFLASDTTIPESGSMDVIGERVDVRPRKGDCRGQHNGPKDNHCRQFCLPMPHILHQREQEAKHPKSEDKLPETGEILSVALQ